ncbi:MAG: phosphate regulon sensor histidine kinase PhoR [Gammaproteobacteria bacterium]|nr:phosphate regulon sensor histidine kinase PhoR [Gammaproteobacteria bacterium]MDH5800870.1 phosphate regulon sensor histidine kinase PhoR [Gammaproteobacteria bacterium]
MANPWLREFWRLLMLSLLALVIGSVVGRVSTVMGIWLGVYFGWHLRNLYKLERWFRKGQRQDPPDGMGIWGDVFYHIYRLKQRNRESKRKLANMLNRFQKSTSAMPDATVVLNEYGEIEWFNKAAKLYLGLKKKKDVGQRIDNLIRNPAFVKLLVSSEESEDPVVISSPVDEQRILSIRMVPYAKNQMLMVVRDITRLHHLEQVRRDFVANISHELKTPLTVMFGYLENFLDDDKDQQWSPASKKALQQMVQQTARMSQIVEDLLMLSKLESDDVLRPEPVPVALLLNSIKQDAQLLAKDERTITLENEPFLQIMGSEKELHSAFSNIVSNAVKYTGKGGCIEIRWYSEDGMAFFEVKDDGMGIPAAHISRLTERFYRVDPGRSREQGGTGLGLAIVKHVLQRHEAQLSINSVPGKGSVFQIRFPAKRVLIKEYDLKKRVS